jgi:hypothetical protein
MGQATRLGALALGGAAAGAAVVAIAAAAWERQTRRAVDRLDAAVDGRAGDERYTPAQLAGLPDPAARYFAFALTPGQRVIRRARLRQAGGFSTRPGAWSPMSATQHVTVRPPGLVWDAAIRMAPGIHVRVRDSYLAGVGRMRGKAAALLTVVDQGGTPEMAVATLQRYLAEAPWVPTALLPTAGVRWTAVDDGTARAALTDRDAAGREVTAEVTFTFDERGAIVGVAADRYRDVNGTPVQTPWVGRYWAYERVNGMMVPREGEVAWLLPEGRRPYWRARLSDFSYDPTP